MGNPQAKKEEKQITQGAQLIYLAATVANVLTQRLSPAQINLLANFLSVVTACVYALLAAQDPSDTTGA